MKNRLKKAEPYLWMAPSLLLMCIMIAFPILNVFELSVSEISRAGVIKGFYGLKNYTAVFTNGTFWRTLCNTLIWTVAVVGLSTILGFALGMALNQEFHGRKFVRAIIVFPWATSLIIQALVWKYILNMDYGSLNVVLLKLGIISNKINYLGNVESSFAWMCAVGIFVTVPFVTFCVLSGLQSIDASFYEAADIDGASGADKLFKLTLPMVRPNLTVSTVLNIIYVFNSFPIIWTITKGAPADRTHTLVTYLYKMAFMEGKSAQAAAVSVIGFAILCVCAGIYMVLSLRSEAENGN